MLKISCLMDSITQDKFACGAMYKHKVVDNQDLQTIGVNIFFFALQRGNVSPSWEPDNKYQWITDRNINILKHKLSNNDLPFLTRMNCFKRDYIFVAVFRSFVHLQQENSISQK